MERFGDLGEEVRSIYQENGGIVQYFNSRFPKLLIYTYRVEQEWKESRTHGQECGRVEGVVVVAGKVL